MAIIPPQTHTNLTKLSQNIKDAFTIENAFESSPIRERQFTASSKHLTLDYSKELIDKHVIDELLSFAEHRKLNYKIQHLFEGAYLNLSEARQALHSALRSSDIHTPHFKLIQNTLNKMSAFAWSIINGNRLSHTQKKIKHIIHVGVGGSDLGPKMATFALKHYLHPNAPEIHFLSNIDPNDANQALDQLNPDHTLIIICSKTFTTLETLENANLARKWLSSRVSSDKIHLHLAAVTSSPEKAIEFGIDEESIFPMWDWVGGRFSLWSAIGLSLMIGIGPDNFQLLLSGARDMDNHFKTTPLDQNIPVIMALKAFWYSNYLHLNAHSIIAYDSLLEYFPNFLQQLDMESLGKSVDINNNPIQLSTGQVIWGGVGTNSQHSFHQLLHQGTVKSSIEFLLPLTSDANPAQHKWMIANCLAQSETLALGTKAINETMSNDCTSIEGNKPHSIIFYEKMTPEILGSLIACYEHKVFAHSVLLNINPFDQWGVELGKQLCKKYIQQVDQPTPKDKSTMYNNILNQYLKYKK